MPPMRRQVGGSGAGDGSGSLDVLGADEARRMTLRAQGVLGRSERPRTPGEVLARLGALQLDTISVLARSHELVCYSRAGPTGRAAVEEACWGRDAAGAPRAVEYWAHAACILPVELWPALAFRRRRMRIKRRWDLDAPASVIDEVRRRLRDEGPMTATQLGGAKRGGPWWDWSPVKVAVELLLDWGEAVCVTRTGWRRVYDLAERALPHTVLAVGEPDDQDCLRQLVRRSGAALGVATAADLADYFRLSRADVAAGLPGSGLVPVRVEGWAQPAWADPSALGSVDAGGRHRSTLLSPFDPLVWDRARAERVFGLTHRLEAYTPAPRRVHGYYAMPVLAGGRMVGRVDPARAGSTLVCRRVGLRSGPGGRVPASVIDGVAAALAEAATWVGSTSVVLEVVDPPAAAAPLRTTLGGYGLAISSP